MDKTALIIGNGEIGRIVGHALSSNYDVEFKDIEEKTISKTIYAMHVAIRYTDDFVNIVKQYDELYKPKYVIIHSTVPVGTMRKFNTGRYYHAPVIGRHIPLMDKFKQITLYISGVENNEVYDYLQGCGIRLRPVVENYETTELAKLLCLARFAVNIDFAKRQKQLCDKYGVSYELAVKEFEYNHNDCCEKLGYGHLKRPLLDYVEGPIGGHCTIPALEMLKEETDVKEVVEKILFRN